MKKIVLIPVNKKFEKETDRLHKIFKYSGAFVMTDCGEDSVSSRIRTAEKQKDTGAILVIGESEIESELFSPRFMFNPILTISGLVEIMKRSVIDDERTK